MALTCQDCGARIELPSEERRRLAGKFFACPDCGASRRLPPAVEEPPIVVRIVENPPRKSAPIAPFSRLPDWRRRIVIATVIFALCWGWLFLSDFTTSLANDSIKSALTIKSRALLSALSASLQTLPFYLPVLMVLGIIALCSRRSRD